MKLTTASKITVVRILLIPVVLVLMYSDFENSMYWALGIFIVASVTDFLDGYVARRFNQVSNMGKFLDPIADKLLVCSVLIVLSDMGMMPAWAVIVVIAREFAVSALRQVAVEGGLVIAAAWSGKIKTASTMVCMVLMMYGVPDTVNTGCWVLIVAVTIYSGLEYFVKNSAVFKS